MFILCILSLVIADRVKIASRDSPDYILTLIGNTKGGSIRMMKESDVDNPTEQSGFELNGDKTELNNHGVIVCGNIWGSGISTCARDSSKKTVFNVIETNTDVTFKTDGGDCLTMADYDIDTKGYYLRLNRCDDSPSQKYKLVDMPKIVQTKTPLAPFPNEANGNSQNNVHDPCSNVNMPKTPLVPFPNTADCNAQNNVNDPCLNVNMSKTPLASTPNAANNNSRNNVNDPCSNVNKSTTPLASAPNAANNNSQNNVNDPCSNVNKSTTPLASAPNAANNNSQNNVNDPSSNVNKSTAPLASAPNAANSNSENNSAGTSSDVNMPNIVFIPVAFESSNTPSLTQGSQFGTNINPFCFDANRSGGPTSFDSVYKFRRPAQPGNECNNHLQWTSVFRRYY